MKINVTKNHIEEGVRYSPLRCPVSLAVKEHLNTNSNVLVGLDDIYIYQGNDSILVKNTEQVERFIALFDSVDYWDNFIFRCMFKLKNLFIKPFSFEMEIPTRFLKD